MKKVFICLCATISMLCSCTSDYGLDVLGLEDFSMSAEKEVSSILSEQSSLFSNSELTLKSMEDYKSAGKLTVEHIFNNDYACYPVYTTDFREIHLVSLEHFNGDTVSVHFKYDYLVAYVDSLLNFERKSITVKELTWNYKGSTFKTIGLFNVYTGEVEYEHILFNTYRTEISSFKNTKILSRGEGTLGKGDIESVSFTYNNTTMYYTVSWNVTGVYRIFDSTDSNGKPIKMRVFIPDPAEVYESRPNVPTNIDEYDLQWGYDIYSSMDAQSRAFCSVSIGFGFRHIVLPTVPINYDELNTNCYNGNGYSYKTMVVNNPVIYMPID